MTLAEYEASGAQVATLETAGERAAAYEVLEQSIRRCAWAGPAQARARELADSYARASHACAASGSEVLAGLDGLAAAGRLGARP